MFRDEFLIRLFDLEVKMSGRVRDKGAMDLLKKQMQGLADGMPEQLDLKTGRLKSKKVKKEKSAEEAAMIDMKKMCKKWLEEPSPKLSTEVEDDVQRSTGGVDRYRDLLGPELQRARA